MDLEGNNKLKKVGGRKVDAKKAGVEHGKGYNTS
jgi:hypothetical protein